MRAPGVRNLRMDGRTAELRSVQSLMRLEVYARPRSRDMDCSGVTNVSVTLVPPATTKKEQEITRRLDGFVPTDTGPIPTRGSDVGINIYQALSAWEDARLKKFEEDTGRTELELSVNARVSWTPAVPAGGTTVTKQESLYIHLNTEATFVELTMASQPGRFSGLFLMCTDVLDLAFGEGTDGLQSSCEANPFTTRIVSSVTTAPLAVAVRFQPWVRYTWAGFTVQVSAMALGASGLFGEVAKATEVETKPSLLTIPLDVFAGLSLRLPGKSEATVNLGAGMALVNIRGAVRPRPIVGLTITTPIVFGEKPREAQADAADQADVDPVADQIADFERRPPRLASAVAKASAAHAEVSGAQVRLAAALANLQAAAPAAAGTSIKAALAELETIRASTFKSAFDAAAKANTEALDAYNAVKASVEAMPDGATRDEQRATLASAHGKLVSEWAKLPADDPSWIGKAELEALEVVLLDVSKNPTPGKLTALKAAMAAGDTWTTIKTAGGL